MPLPPRIAPAAKFRDHFCCGTIWPIPSVALAALVDLGMSDACIGRYFAVSPAAVTAARAQSDISRAPDMHAT